jgi:prepilin-type N-terminal cleavage/methylation domain-containing protein
MKKAFTMIELVFVIVVVGILSYMVASSFTRNPLREAADQLVMHIRYTQHLAMMDDKFDPNESQWFMRRWAIRFQQNTPFGGVPHDNVWAYTIFSDLPNFAGHHPDLAGMAFNPENTTQYLSGGYDNTLDIDDARAMRTLQLGIKYGVTNITFGGGCRADTMFINFDYLGRPMNSFPPAASTHAYQPPVAGWHYLLTNQCQIILTDASGNAITIAIEPETGYTHIL